MSAITDEMVEAGVEEIRKAKHTCFDRWTDNDAIRAVLEASVADRIAALEAENERLRNVAKMVDAWGNGIRHHTAHESKMVKAARAALEDKP